MQRYPLAALSRARADKEVAPRPRTRRATDNADASQNYSATLELEATALLVAPLRPACAKQADNFPSVEDRIVALLDMT